MIKKFIKMSQHAYCRVDRKVPYFFILQFIFNENCETLASSSDVTIKHTADAWVSCSFQQRSNSFPNFQVPPSQLFGFYVLYITELLPSISLFVTTCLAKKYSQILVIDHCHSNDSLMYLLWPPENSVPTYNLKYITLLRPPIALQYVRKITKQYHYFMEALK